MDGLQGARDKTNFKRKDYNQLGVEEQTASKMVKVKREEEDGETDGDFPFVPLNLHHTYVNVKNEEEEPKMEVEAFDIKEELVTKEEPVPEGLSAAGFFSRRVKRSKWVAPQFSADSDLELDDDPGEAFFDGDVNPDLFLDASDDELTPPSGAVFRVRPQDMPDEDDDSNSDEEHDDSEPPRKKTKKDEQIARERNWKREDISYAPLPPYIHSVPSCIRSPFEYFQDMFTVPLLEDIVYQTNLYARQKDVKTTFHTDKHELLMFIGIVLYMGVLHLPAIGDYWSANTRVPQVADVMSSKRFRLLRSQLHFNNNENAIGSTDRFFKIRPIFSSLTRQFLEVKSTPTQCVDEVMVAYKGTRAGSLGQFIKDKPDRWGYKLFCRASTDGFIHDVLMYQGETTFTNHHMQLNKEESEHLMSTKTVIVLAKTIKRPDQAAIYADNYFTSMDLVEYLKEKLGCRYVGMARVNRIGHAPLMSTKEMDKKTVHIGEYDYASSNGILALRWKDSKIVTLLSSDAGLQPIQTIRRHDRNTKKKIDVPCPNVIKNYNEKMGGIDKLDMLTHLYKTPMRARRWYVRLFGYALDLCVCNAWILYKRDCKALGEKPMSLKFFRLDISRFARSQMAMVSRVTKLSPEGPMQNPRRGQRSLLPPLQRRYDLSKAHMPTFVSIRQTCKHCSSKKNIHRSRWMCEVCQVALCLSDTRNCFKSFHTPPQDVSQQQPATSTTSP